MSPIKDRPTRLLTVIRFSDDYSKLNGPEYLHAYSLLEEYHLLLSKGEGLSLEAWTLQNQGNELWKSLTEQEQAAIVLHHNRLLEVSKSLHDFFGPHEKEKLPQEEVEPEVEPDTLRSPASEKLAQLAELTELESFGSGSVGPEIEIDVDFSDEDDKDIVYNNKD